MAMFHVHYRIIDRGIERARKKGQIKESERVDLREKLEAARRLHEVGDRDGCWDLLGEVHRETPGVNIIEVENK